MHVNACNKVKDKDRETRYLWWFDNHLANYPRAPPLGFRNPLSHFFSLIKLGIIKLRASNKQPLFRDGISNMTHEHSPKPDLTCIDFYFFWVITQLVS